MELRDALTQIARIRQQVARTEQFRGYRAIPVAFSGLLAWAAAGVQDVWLPDPVSNIGGYLALWLGVAGISVLATLSEMTLYFRRHGTPLEMAKVRLAMGQFCPCLAAGALLTLVLVRHVPQSTWMLPGLWSMFFGLGILASYRLLTPAIFWVGVFYLAAGSLVLAWSGAKLSPWEMGIPFGLGQCMTAFILYWTLERCHDET